MKTLQNNFTTPEQSKRLSELGVPADSADCYHSVADKKNIYIRNTEETSIFSRDGFIPCWSVGRLMEIITMCHLSRDGRFCFRKDMCESLVETICEFVKCGEMDFSKLEE